jgi:type IV pilus assembly protein PilW
MKYMSIYYKSTRGVTLIELMLAVAISMILLLGVGSVYFNSKRTYLVQEDFAHLQENARVAMHFMIKDIRMAGYLGCAWNNNLDYEDFLTDSNAVDDAAMGNFLVGLEGMEATNSGPGDNVNLAGPPTAGWDRALPSYITNAPLVGSDIMIVRYADGDGVKLAINNNAANFWIDDLGNPAISNIGGFNCHDATGVCEGDILLATDCEKSRLFQVTGGMTADGNGIKLTHAAGGGGISPGNTPSSWGGASGKYPEFEVGDSSLFRAASYAYYLANNANGVPSLFRQELRPGSTPQELITGVENMQILYGIDTDKTDASQKGDGIANRYATANLVNVATDNVVSARISLLLRTDNEMKTKTTAAPAAKNYLLAGTTAATATTLVSPADRRLRKVFTSTVKIRNKGLQ